MAEQTIVEKTMSHIVESIANGKYKVGTKLPNEFTLLKELGVGRNSLRESIKILCAMGVLEIRRGDGTYVCSQISPSFFDKIVYGLMLNLSSDDELVELREMLDEQTVRTVIDKIDDKGLALLKNNIDEMRKAKEAYDMQKVQELDYDFHMLLIDLCENPFWSRMIKGVYIMYVKYMIRNLFAEMNATLALYHHTNIYNCIKNKDEKSVKNVVDQSLEGWKDAFANRKANEKKTTLKFE
jgi:GntR family transcriptional repressor for pyruvate dehydrogenase complex